MLVLRSLSPLTEEINPNKKTLDFIKKLEGSQEYQVFQRTRPEAILTLEDHLGENFSDLTFSESELALFKGSPDINLFSNSERTLSDVMILAYLYDAVIDLRYIKKPSSPLALLANKKQLLEVATHYPYDLHSILLPFPMSQSELILWVKENWGQIRSATSQLETFTPTYISKNLETGHEIDQLKKQGLSFKQISEKLEEKYPEDERFLDYNQVRSIHQQFKKYWKDSENSINKLRILNSILKRT